MDRVSEKIGLEVLLESVSRHEGSLLFVGGFREFLKTVRQNFNQ